MRLLVKNIFRDFTSLWAFRILLFFIVKKILGLNYFNFYFSQLGEDIVLVSLLGQKKTGFYIDVGCNEPIKYNNTFYYYLRGWRGINIDANHSIIDKFNKVRPRDLNIWSAISDKQQELTYYKSSLHPEVNTLDKATYLKWKDIWKFETQEKIVTKTLDEILDIHLKIDESIDFLSIDVEGHDLNVLKSINLTKYKPQFILVEIHDFDLDKKLESEIYNYLINNNYSLIGFISINAFFKCNH